MFAVWATLSWADDPELHQERFRAARAAEDAGRFEEAIAACREAVAAAPAGPRTTTCERRIAFLEARRDPDGAFGTWEALESVRRRWRSEDPDVLLAEVEALRDRPTTPAVEAELTVWLARDALSRRNDPSAALAVTEGRSGSLDDPSWRQVAELRAVALARVGRVDEARALEDTVRVPVVAGAERPTPVDQVVIARRRMGLAWVSAGSLAAFTVLALPFAVRGLRRGALPLGLVPIGIAGVGGGLVAFGWDVTSAAGVPRLLLGLVTVHLLALGALVEARERPWLRRAVRLLAALATLGVGYLSLWSTATLAWVGL